MDGLLSIGDFSRMTFLSVKTLRHYHDVGLLAPARIDEHTRYRYYRLEQVSTAQLIRRFRSLDLPVEQVRAVLDAPDEETRNRVIVDHLERMSAQLRDTQSTVESLRRMLSTPLDLSVTYRDEPPLTALGIVETVDAAEMMGWWLEAFTELHAALRSSGLARTGLDGALFPTDLFAEERGELVAFVPVAAETPPGVRAGAGHYRAGSTRRRDGVRRPARRPRPGLQCRRRLGLGAGTRGRRPRARAVSAHRGRG